MPAKLTNQDIDRRIEVDGRGFIRTTESNGDSGKMGWRCPNGHEWIAKPNNVLGKLKQGCPHCSGNAKRNNEDVDRLLLEDGRGYVRTTECNGTSKHMGFLCPAGHEWSATPSSVLGKRKRGCPHCAGSIKKDNDYIDRLLLEDGRGYVRTSESSGSTRPMLFLCPEGHLLSRFKCLAITKPGVLTAQATLNRQDKI